MYNVLCIMMPWHCHLMVCDCTFIDNDRSINRKMCGIIRIVRVFSCSYVAAGQFHSFQREDNQQFHDMISTPRNAGRNQSSIYNGWQVAKRLSSTDPDPGPRGESRLTTPHRGSTYKPREGLYNRQPSLYPPVNPFLRMIK